MVPAYNEEDVIMEFYNRVSGVTLDMAGYDFEFLFINDGSRDRTLPIIKGLREKDPRVSYVDLSRNFGKEVAMLAGFDYARGDAVVIIDSDLQDPPELIKDMVFYWEEGYEDVYAKRKDRQGETWMKKWTSQSFYRVLKKATDIPIQEDTGDFRLLDARCVNALRQMRESQRYTKGLFSWLGFKKKEILFSRDARVAGKTKWNYGKLINLAIEGVTSFTTYPLKLSTYIGGVVSITAFIYIFFIIIKTIAFGEPVRGYPSLMSVILFLGGIQLLSLGVIGEYLGRIFNETKNRPVYLVQEYNGERDL